MSAIGMGVERGSMLNMAPMRRSLSAVARTPKAAGLERTAKAA